MSNSPRKLFTETATGVLTRGIIPLTVVLILLIRAPQAHAATPKPPPGDPGRAGDRLLSPDDVDLYEPNDTPDEAYGPLALGQTYAAYIWDETDINDYYHVTPGGQRICVTLSHIPPDCDYDLYVYHYDTALEGYVVVGYANQWGSVDEIVEFVAHPGRRYFVRVYADQENGGGFSDRQPYHLQVAVRPVVYLPFVRRW